MLQNFRKYTQGWVATTLGILLSVAFLMWGVENYLRGNSQKEIVAKVNGSAITSKELNSDYQRAIIKIKDQVGANFAAPAQVQAQIKDQVLNNLIIQTALVQAAKKSGFLITPYQVSATIKQLPVFQENSQFSRDRFNQVINHLDYTQQSFFAEISRSLLLNQVASGIVDTDFVLPNELNQVTALFLQTRSFNYVIIPKQASDQPSAAAIQQYYNEHQSEFKAPQKIQLEFLELNVDDLKKKVILSEQEISDYLANTNQNNIKDSKMRATAKAQLLTQKADQEFITQSEKLADLSYTNSSSLSDVAKELDLQVKTTDYFTQKGGTSEFTKNPKIIAAAFAADFIKSDANSNLIELNPGAVAVIRVKRYQPEAALPLKDVTDAIKAKLLNQDAMLQARKRGEGILTQAKNAQDLSKIAGQQGLHLVSKENINRNNQNIDAQVLNAAFSIPPESSNKVVGVSLKDGSYALIALTTVTTPAAEKISTIQKEQFLKSYPLVYGKLVYELYTASQVNKARVKAYSK